MQTERTRRRRKIPCLAFILEGRLSAAVAMSGTAILSFEVAEQTTLAGDGCVCLRLGIEFPGSAVVERASAEYQGRVSFDRTTVWMDRFDSCVALCAGIAVFGCPDGPC